MAKKMKDRFAGTPAAGHVYEAGSTCKRGDEWYWVEEIDFYNDSAFAPDVILARAIGMVKRAASAERFEAGHTPPFSPSARLRVTVELVPGPSAG